VSNKVKSGNRVIRVLANGGLGNQLFIWNLAHNLENKYRRKIEIIYPTSGTNRVCEILHLMDYCSHQIKVTESNKLHYAFAVLDRINRKSSVMARLLTQIFSISQTNLPSEIFEHSSKPPRFIRGYFQSPAFVEGTIDLYRSELLIATKNAAENSEYWNSDVTKTKMLHIRRGDFISTKANVGLLSIEYFASKVKKGEKVIIFTDAKKDDPEIKGSFPNSVIFGSDLLDTWTSFSLLSHASHLIASNSTFSWWAGFISLMRGGIVTAPNPWTRTSIYGEHYLETNGFSVSSSQFVEA
jgi:hypothetical protein